MDARSDVSALKDRHPELWSQYKNCREQISSLNQKETLNSGEVSLYYHLQRKTNKRQQLSKALDDLQNQIRQCPGLERFLLGPTEIEIKGLAQDGPLVCFNISNVSSEAFLVTTTEIQNLRLPDLMQQDIQHNVKLFASRGNPARRNGSLEDSDNEDDDIAEELAQSLDVSARLWKLWIHAVRPVLDRLMLLGQKDTLHDLPRVWWIGGGPMALMPLHAAGDHRLGSTDNTLNHVMSSYIPTMKALQFARSEAPLSVSDSSLEKNILIVSMPTTPKGYKPIKSSGEVAAIESQSKSWASTTTLDRPSKDKVLNALNSCTIARFACHGEADQTEPAKSALLLGRNVLEKLTLEDMDTVSHGHAQIAYLSACSTAEVKVRNLADESIHLASAFQLAGSRHVIGTLWAADDNAAVNIASKLYENLKLLDRVGGALVAQALHNAILYHYKQDGNSATITNWAPFIHLGC